MITGLVTAAVAVVAALLWPSLASAAGAALAVGVTLTALFVLISSESAPGRRGEAGHERAELLERLPLGVVLVDPRRRTCIYRNAHADRWVHPGTGTTNPVLPWDTGHLDNVAAQLSEGAFSEPLPRDSDLDTRPAEVRWQAYGDLLLATVRELGDREEQRVILDELDPDRLPFGGMQVRLTALEPLCWEVAEVLAGDRRPLGVEALSEGARVFGDPALLRAALSEVIEHATGVGEPLVPVTLRLVEQDGSVAIQVDDGAGDVAEAEEAFEGFGLAQHLVAMHGGRLRVHTLGPGRRTELVLPRAP